MKQEGKQRKWLEPVSVRAGCGGSARRRFFVSVKEVAKKLCPCVPYVFLLCGGSV